MASERQDAPAVYALTDPRFGELGWLAIDGLLNGKSCGGIRIGAAVSREEVAALAQTMSLKYGIANIRLGGAKSGLKLPPGVTPLERQERVEAFGRALAPWIRDRRYIPGADLGSSHEDMLTVLQAAGCPAQDSAHGAAAGTYTALGVFVAMREAMRSVGRELAGVRVAVQGFGKVGGDLARYLAEAGAVAVAVATSEGAVMRREGLDITQLIDLRQRLGSACVTRVPGAERISHEALLTLDVDVLVPCAGPWVIHDGNVEQIRARWVIPAANIPATPAIQQRLLARGIHYLPDFLCNCGGVLANTLEWRGLTSDQIRQFFLTELSHKVARILNAAAAAGRSVIEVAEGEARTNIARMEDGSAGNGHPGGLRRAIRRWHLLLPRVAEQVVRKRLAGSSWVRPLAYQFAASVFHERPLR